MTRKSPATPEVSPVFARGLAARPRVQAPDSPIAVWAGVGGAALLGVLVFNGLSAGREAQAQTPSPAAAPAQQSATPVPAPVQAAPPPPQASPAPPIQAGVGPPVNPEAAHWRAPTVVVDFTGADQTVAAQAQVQAAGSTTAPGVVPSPVGTAEERFAARLSGSLGDTARAGQMRDLGRTVPQGTVVAAVLETAINSDLPGSVRGVVSRDVRSFDGSRVLIPRGSKLVGQYKSAAAQGQTRAFVVWERIISPTGVTIEIGSPATDRLGRGGLAGEVDRHFFQRFGGAILLSVISAAGTALSDGDSATLVIGSTTQATQAASSVLQSQMNIPDTIKVAQGVPVQVFVARDLDFSAVVR